MGITALWQEGGTFPSETAFHQAGAGRPGGARRPAWTLGCWAPPPGGCAAAPCGSASTRLQQLPHPRRGGVAVVRGGRAEVRVGFEGGIREFRMSPPCALPRDSSPGAAGLLLHEHSSCVPLGGAASAPIGDCGGARAPLQAPESCRSSWEGGSDRRLLRGGVWGPGAEREESPSGASAAGGGAAAREGAWQLRPRRTKGKGSERGSITRVCVVEECV